MYPQLQRSLHLTEDCVIKYNIMHKYTSELMVKDKIEENACFEH